MDCPTGWDDDDDDDEAEETVSFACGKSNVRPLLVASTTDPRFVQECSLHCKDVRKEGRHANK